MRREYSKKDFNMLMEEFQALHEEKPKRVDRESYYSLLKMGKVKVEGYNKFLSSLGLIFAGLIVLMCIISIYFDKAATMFVLFGLVFFLAGYTVTIRESAPVLFLFSHGLLGFCIMNGYSFVKIIQSPVMTDNPTNLFILLGVAIITEICSLLFGSLVSTSDTYKLNPINRSIPFALAAISTIIIQTMAIVINL